MITYEKNFSLSATAPEIIVAAVATTLLGRQNKFDSQQPWS